MKAIVFVSLALLSFPVFGQENANAIDKYFKQYVEDERFTIVYLSPKLFELLGKFQFDEMDMDDEEAQAFFELVKETRGLRILTTDENPRGFYDEAKQKINTSEYEVLMTVRNNKDKENIEFLVIQNGDYINELLLLVGGQEEFVMMSFIGKLSLKNISNLANTMDDDGN